MSGNERCSPEGQVGDGDLGEERAEKAMQS